MTRSIFLLALAGALCAESPLAFRKHAIATGLTRGYQVLPIDLNRDGRQDLLALASGSSELVWFENPSWKRHVIASGFSQMINVALQDVDGDGIPEILLAHDFNNQAPKSIGSVSLLKSSGDVSQPWSVKLIDQIPSSHRIRVVNKLFVNAPLTDAKAIAPMYEGKVPVVLYEPGDWKRRVLSEERDGVMHGITIYDWDGDGVEDVLTASFAGIHLLSKKTGKWVRTLITTAKAGDWGSGGSSDVAVGRSRMGRFLASVEPWHGNELSIYSEKQKYRDRVVIDSEFQDGHTLITADLDGDSFDEIVLGSRGGGGSVAVYQYTGKEWKKHALDQKEITAAGCAVADVGGTKLPDIVCIGSATANLVWYENATK